MSGGVATAAEEALAQLPDRAQVVQQALDLSPGEVGDLDAASPLGPALVKRRPGRPPGARSRRTDAVAAWLLSQARHPVLTMLEAASMPVEEFLTKAGFHPDEEGLEVGEGGADRKVWRFSNDLRMEALKLQFRLAEVAAPYVAQKLPLAVQVDAKAAVQLTLGGVSLPAHAGAAVAAAVVEGEVMGVRLGPKSDG